MPKAYKYILIALSLVILLTGLIIFTFQGQRTRIIKRAIYLDLPASAKIEKFSYHFIYGSFNAKVKLPIEDMPEIRRQLNEYFYGPEAQIETAFLPRYFRDSNQDVGIILETYKSLGDKQILICHIRVRLYALITKETDGYFYLYLSC